jgi:hypothetical protein
VIGDLQVADHASGIAMIQARGLELEQFQRSGRVSTCN